MNNRIKEIREENHLTQEEFGKIIGSARNTIANYENGKRTPSNTTILSICREFKVNKEWLLYGTEPKSISSSSPHSYLPTNLMLASELNSTTPFFSLISNIISTYQKLTPENQSVIDKFIDSVLQERMD